MMNRMVAVGLAIGVALGAGAADAATPKAKKKSATAPTLSAGTAAGTPASAADPKAGKASAAKAGKGGAAPQAPGTPQAGAKAGDAPAAVAPGAADKAAAGAPVSKPVEPKPIPPANTNDAAAVARAVQGFYDRTAAFQARFMQVVKKKGLSKGIQREGIVYLTKGDAAGRPGKMRWDYPTEEIFYFSDGEVLWSYERRERLAVRVPVKNSQVAQATTWLTGQGNLAANFTMELVPSTVPDTWALKLVPRTGTQTLRSLTLVVDKKTAAVRATVLEDPLGDSTTLQWLEPRYDAIDDKVFAWAPPAGVQIKNL